MPSKNLAILVMLLAINLGSSLRMQGATPQSAKGQNGVVSWAAPAGEQLFENYTLRVYGQAVPVYFCRVSAVPFDQVWPGYQRPWIKPNWQVSHTGRCPAQSKWKSRLSTPSIRWW